LTLGTHTLRPSPPQIPPPDGLKNSTQKLNFICQIFGLVRKNGKGFLRGPFTYFSVRVRHITVHGIIMMPHSTAEWMANGAVGGGGCWGRGTNETRCQLSGQSNAGPAQIKWKVDK